MSGCRIKPGMTDKAVYGKTLLIYAMLYALCFILSAYEKTLFPDCSKMPLPPPRKAGLRAGRQMQVELCEIPLAGAPKMPCRERFETVPYGCTPQMGVFQQSARLTTSSFAYSASLPDSSFWNPQPIVLNKTPEHPHYLLGSQPGRPERSCHSPSHSRSRRSPGQP
jgi:hypothetical protein